MAHPADAGSAPSPTIQYARVRHVVGTRARDVVVLLDPRGGQYYSLNDVGGRIWELLERPRTIEAVRARLAEEYDVVADVLLADVRRAIDELQALGIVTPVAEPAA